MSKKRMIAIIKATGLVALIIVAIVAIIMSLGASVAWITGWSLSKGSMAVVLGALVSIGSQAAVKDL